MDRIRKLIDDLDKTINDFLFKWEETFDEEK